MKEDAKIIVRYEGKTVYSCDYFSFEPASTTETGISYKLCVRPLNFTDPDCSVQLEMKSSYLGSSLHVSLTVSLKISSHDFLTLIRCRILTLF